MVLAGTGATDIVGQDTEHMRPWPDQGNESVIVDSIRDTVIYSVVLGLLSRQLSMCHVWDQ